MSNITTLNYQEKEIQIKDKFESVKKRYGLFFTPEWVIDFMIQISDFKYGRALEPACGLGQFLSKLAENIIRHSRSPNYNIGESLLGVEVIKELVDEANKYISAYLSSKGYDGNYNKIPILNKNYLLLDLKSKFDLIIGNPPYGIMGHSSHYPIPVTSEDKYIYKTVFNTWHGKYNIYAAFIEKSVQLLKDNGKLIFIVPTTFMILDEFCKLREFLSLNGKISVYYLGQNVFKTANVSTAILKLEKNKHGLELWDFSSSDKRMVVKKDYYRGELMRFEDEFTRDIEKNSFLLGDLFEIHIAARSPEIKRCPFVSMEKKTGFLPILKGSNLQPNKILYNEKSNGYWIKKDKIEFLRDYYKEKRIVVGHTKGGKIEAAIDYKKYPWMGDVHQLIPKEFGLFAPTMPFEDVVRILNSQLMNKYVSVLYKNITPHTTATQLKLLPLHKLIDWIKLEEKYGENRKYRLGKI